MLGNEHPDTLNSANNLGSTLLKLNRLTEAERMLDETWDARSRILGREHPLTLNTLRNLALAAREQGRHGEAEQLFGQVMEARERVLGEEHPATLAVTGHVADMRARRGRAKDAKRMLGQAIDVAARTLDPDHPVRTELQRILALPHSRQEQYAESEALLLGLYEALPDESRAERAKTARAIADLYTAWGRTEQAAAWNETATAPRG